MELYPKTTALDLPVKQKLLESLKIWGYCFLGFIISGIVISLTSLTLQMTFHFDIAKTNQIKSVFHNPPDKFLLVPIVAPLLEECIFRLWQDYKIKHIIIAAGVVLTFILFKMAGIHESPHKYIYEGVLAISAAIFIFKKDTAAPTLQVSLKTKKILYYLVAVIFGLGHIFNFSPIHYSLLIFYPVFVLPQLIMGFGFGYVRIKYGFFFGFLLHCLTNTLPILFHL